MINNYMTKANTYIGTPCKRAGHTLRYVRSGACVECDRLRPPYAPRTSAENAYWYQRAKAKRLADPTAQEEFLEHQREIMAAWRKENSNEYKAYQKEYHKKYRQDNAAKIKAYREAYKLKQKDTDNE